jgi:hypothetical protein
MTLFGYLKIIKKKQHFSVGSYHKVVRATEQQQTTSLDLGRKFSRDH